MSDKNQFVPVVLTGRVYVQGVLEEGFWHARSPEKPERGDFRLHSHLDVAGRKRREAGETKAGFSGILRASLFDGTAWRTFKLAKEASAPCRHFKNGADRDLRAAEMLAKLASLAGFTCNWQSTAYAVNRAIPPVEIRKAKSETAPPPPKKRRRRHKPAKNQLPLFEVGLSQKAKNIFS